MSKEVWVLGGGGHAKVAIATFQSAGLSVAAVYDDDASKTDTQLLGVTIKGPTPDDGWWSEEDRHAFIAIGDNSTREKLSTLQARWQTAKHPNSNVHESVQVGEGTLICAGAVIQPDTRLGRHSIANTSCSIDHDCEVADFVHVGPGATLAGGVRVGKRTFVGAGATLMPGVTIGANVTVGAGAVVIADVSDGQTVVGIPARELKLG